MRERIALSRFTDHPWLRMGMIAALVATFALAACGRKGPLDPPPAGSVAGAPAESPPAAPDKRIPLDVLLN